MGLKAARPCFQPTSIQSCLSLNILVFKLSFFLEEGGEGGERRKSRRGRRVIDYYFRKISGFRISS